jgi:hypothetical protein
MRYHGGMKAAPDLPAPENEGTPFENFDRLFRAVVSVPKSEVEKEEARERSKNQKKRAAKRKRQKSGR